MKMCFKPFPLLTNDRKKTMTIISRVILEPRKITSEKGPCLATTNYYDLILLSYLRVGNLLARILGPALGAIVTRARSLLFIVYRADTILSYYD